MLNDVSAESVSEGDANQTAADALGAEGSRSSVGVSRRVITLPRILVLLVGLIFLVGLAFPKMRQDGESAFAQTQAVTSPVCGTWNIASEPDLGLGIARTAFGSIGIISNDDIWIAGGSSTDNGYMDYHALSVHWDGNRLSTVLAPELQTKHYVIQAISGISRDDVWAVGFSLDKDDKTDDPRVQLILHWDGSQWSVIPNPKLLETASYSSLNQIAALSRNDVWAVGLYREKSPDKTLIEHWDGTQWNVIPSPNIGTFTNILDDIRAISAANIWAVGRVRGGTYNEGITTMHWDGNQWGITDTPSITSTAYFITDATITESGDVWAVGGTRGCCNESGKTLAARWDGKKWSVVPSPNHPNSGENQLDEVVAVSDNDVWAMGHRWDLDGSPPRALFLHWEGASWSEVPSPNISNGQTFNDIAVAPNGDVWGVGYSQEDEDDRTGKAFVAQFARCK